MREEPRYEPPRRKRGGAAKFMMFLLAAGAVAGGGYWGAQQFLAPPSAPASGETADAPDPLPLSPADTDAALAETDEATAVADEAIPEPAAAAPAQTTPPPAQTRPQPQTPRAPPPAATQPPRNAALVLPTTPLTEPGAAPAQTEAETTRQLERCLGRLVRLCPGSANASRPGFAEDGSLSSAERALLRQRALFEFSDPPSNLANCQRHLNAGATPALSSACNALPSAGPPG